MPSPNFGTDGLLATTLRYYIPTLEDNVFSSKVLLWALRAAGSIENVDGGEKIIQPLMYAEAPNKGSYADADVFSTTANTGIGAAEFEWRQYYGLVSFTGIELAKNKGKHALLSLMQARMEQIEMTIAEQINAMLFDDGSGNSGKDFWGLDAIVNSADPTVRNFGNIDRDTNSYWQSVMKTASTADTLALVDMANVYNSASEGNDHPTNIITTQTGFEDYEALLQPQERFEDVASADGGFQNLLFKGAPVAFDAQAAAATGADAPMWFLNLKYIKLKTLSGVWFDPSDVLTPTNQDVFYKHLKCYGNLIASNVKRQGRLYNIHA